MAARSLGRGDCASNIYFTLPGVPGSQEAHPLTGADSFMIPRFARAEGEAEPHGGFGIWGGIQRIAVPRFLQKRRDAAFGFACVRSEVEPRPENRVGIDPDLHDDCGIPALRIECAWSERDARSAQRARADAEAMIDAAGGERGPLQDHFPLAKRLGILDGLQDDWRLSTPGMFAHEVGGARMSASPETGVVDPDCRVWDVPNVLVTDGACWPSCGWQDPTLHMMALTTRAGQAALRDAP